MPNWVKNIVHMEGSSEDIARVKELICDKDRPDRIDFDALIPMPERLKVTSGGYDRQYVALYLKTLNDGHKEYLRHRLATVPVSFYGTYLKKYEKSFTMDISENILRWMQANFMSEYERFSPKCMEDGTKTTVKCQEGDVFSKETGLALCIAKKSLGNMPNFNNVFKKWIPEEEPNTVETLIFNNLTDDLKKNFVERLGEAIEENLKKHRRGGTIV